MNPHVRAQIIFLVRVMWDRPALETQSCENKLEGDEIVIVKFCAVSPPMLPAKITQIYMWSGCHHVETLSTRREITTYYVCKLVNLKNPTKQGLRWRSHPLVLMLPSNEWQIQIVLLWLLQLYGKPKGHRPFFVFKPYFYILHVSPSNHVRIHKERRFDCLLLPRTRWMAGSDSIVWKQFDDEPAFVLRTFWEPIHQKLVGSKYKGML